MTLRDLMSRHARMIAGATQSGLAEAVTWVFKDGSPEVTFTAVVKRLDLQPATLSSPAATRRRVQIEVPRHATLGVLRVTKGDRVRVATRIGDDPVDCDIVRIVGQDDALFVVEVTE